MPSRTWPRAQREVTVAQRNLNAARKEGLEQLEDIAFAAEDAALAEQRASLNLEDAYNQLLAVSELAPDNRARVEAELAFKEAELNMRQAKDHREDADRDQRKAAKSGVEGTDAMISARNDLADAQEREADAAKDLADARRNEAEVAEDNAKRIRDALQGVADAQDRVRDAHKRTVPAAAAATKTVDAFAEAMKKLGPEQREFVNRILGMRGAFQRFRNAVAEPLFAGLNKSLDILQGSGFTDVLQKGLAGTSRMLGQVAVQGARLAASPGFQKNLGDAMASNNTAIRNFGSAGVHLADAFVSIADAAGPLFEDFSRWVNVLTKGWAETLRTKNATGELTQTINTGGQRVKEFWALGKQLWRTLKTLGKAANDAANSFGDLQAGTPVHKGFIPTMTENLKSFNDKLEKNPDLVDKFRTALNNMVSAGKAVGNVLSPFIDMGSDPKFGEAMDKIAESDAFERLGDTATDALPAFADLVVAIADMVADLSESGSIKHFIENLSLAAHWMSKLTGWLADTGILKWLGYVTGAILTIKLFWKALKIGTSPFVGLIKGVGKFGRGIRDGTAKIKDSWKEARKGEGVFKTLGTKAKETFSNMATRFGNIFRSKGKKKDLKFPKEVTTPTPDTDAADKAKATAEGNELSTAYANGIREGMAKVTAALTAIDEAVAAKLTLMGTELKTKATAVGVQLMSGLAAGIRESEEIPVTAASSAATNILTAIRNTLGVKSPSTITANFGRQTIAGVPVGMREATPAAVAEAELAGAKIVQGVRTGATGGASAGTKVMGSVQAGIKTGGATATVVAETQGAKIGSALTTGAKAGAAGMTTAIGGAATTTRVQLAGVNGALVGTQVAMKSTSTVARISSLGVRAFSGAMALVGGPFGLIMLLLPLLIPLFMKLDKKFHIVKTTVKLLTDGFGWLWEKAKELFNYLMEVGGKAIKQITDAFQPFKDILDTIGHKIRDFFGWLRKKWPLLLAILGGPFGLLVYFVIKKWDKIINFFKKIPARVRKIFHKLWDPLVKRLQDAKDNIEKKWRNFLGMYNKWKSDTKEKLRKIFQPFLDRFTDMRANLRKKWNNFVEWIRGWPGTLRTGLKNIFNGIGIAIVNAMNFVSDKLNWLIGKLNDVLAKFGGGKINLRFKHYVWNGFAEGGPVKGPGGPKSDRIPALLSNGEHVLTAREVSAMGGHRGVAQMRESALRGKSAPGKGGLGDVLGGIASGIGNVVGDVGDALKKGYEYAFKWILSKFKGMVGDTNTIPKKFAVGMIDMIANKIVNRGKNEDEEAAARAASSSGSGPAAVWRALRSIGLSKIQTAGVMGNMQSESGFDPHIIQNNGRSLNPAQAGSGGYGLVQWTPGRKLIPYLHGKKPTINTEITALSQQLAGRGPSSERTAGRMLHAANTIYEATYAFLNGYERPQSRVISGRFAQAKHWYSVFKGSDAISSAGAAGAAYTGSPGGWTYPVSRRVPISNWPGGNHRPANSIDFDGVSGDAIRAASKGRVSHTYHGYSDSHGRYGNHIFISHAHGISTVYAHLASLAVRAGQSVRTGQKLGMMGTTGHSTGVHLHFEVRGDGWTDDWLRRHGIRLAKGGVIAPSATGTMALLAEAGKAERVTPLDRDGFTPAERKIIETLEVKMAGGSGGGGGGGDTFHIHPSERMDEARLADLVARRVAWKRRRGAGR